MSIKPETLAGSRALCAELGCSAAREPRAGGTELGRHSAMCWSCRNPDKEKLDMELSHFHRVGASNPHVSHAVVLN